jgi:hypothetical protein
MSKAEQELSAQREVISELISRLAGVHTLLAGIDAKLGIEEAFENTAVTTGICKLVRRAEQISFADVPEEILAPRLGSLPDGGPKGDIRQTEHYEIYRKLLSQWAGVEIGRKKETEQSELSGGQGTESADGVGGDTAASVPAG